MSENYFFTNSSPLYIEQIMNVIKGEIITNNKDINKIYITNIKNIEDASIGDLTFINNKKYYNDITNCKASVCLIPESLEVVDINTNTIFIKCSNPYLEYSKIISKLFKVRKSKAVNHKILYDKVEFGENVVIEENVDIGKNVFIDHNVVIKAGVKIGDNSIILAGSYISYSHIGKNVIIHPGVRIGTDGFGFASSNGFHNKILHIGMVKIGDNVEIGANSTIDRGSIKNTIIGDNTIIDNLVQIGHNVQIGKSCIIVSQVGISGSTIIEDFCVIGGQAGIAGHLKIGKNSQIAAKSGVINNVSSGQVVGGYPSQPIMDWHRQTITLKNLIKNRNKK